ncbi:MAG: hypothetical protein HKM07_03020 [Chlamydiae bacterium]|nr:hypothetical protein [Chlamydiota bacterium]
MAFARLESYLRQPHYPQLPDMKRLVQISIPSAANQVYAFLCTKKEWALGGVAVAAIVFAVAKYFRSLPEFPFAEMRTSQNCAVVTIGMAREKHLRSK